MTLDEWKPIAARIVRRWPHVDWQAHAQSGAIDQMFTDLADLEVDHVAAGCEALYRDGREFPPNGAQVRAKVVELGQDVPDWGEAAKVIRDCAGYLSRRDERLAPEHPLIAAFVRSVGWTEATHACSPDRMAEAQTRERWAAFVRQQKRDATYLGVPSVGLRQLERVNSGPRRLGDVLANALESGDAA